MFKKYEMYFINHKIKNTSLIEKDNKKVEFGKVSSLGK